MVSFFIMRSEKQYIIFTAYVNMKRLLSILQITVLEGIFYKGYQHQRRNSHRSIAINGKLNTQSVILPELVNINVVLDVTDLFGQGDQLLGIFQ